MRLVELQQLAPQLHELFPRSGASLFGRVEQKSALEDLLLTRIDLILRRNFKQGLRSTVEAEAAIPTVKLGYRSACSRVSSPDPQQYERLRGCQACPREGAYAIGNPELGTSLKVIPGHTLSQLWGGVDGELR